MKFGTVPPEVRADRSLDGLAPKFRDAVERMIESLNAKGLDAIVAESVRTEARQQYLHGFGREYDDGRGVVTNSPTASTSWHGFGLAVDVISKSAGWDAPPAFWAALGIAAECEGLTWGGTWKFRDLPHVQAGPPMRPSPSSRAAQLVAEGGLPKLWSVVGWG